MSRPGRVPVGACSTWATRAFDKLRPNGMGAPWPDAAVRLRTVRAPTQRSATSLFTGSGWSSVRRRNSVRSGTPASRLLPG